MQHQTTLAMQLQCMAALPGFYATGPWTLSLSGGAPLFIMCLCLHLQSRKDLFIDIFEYTFIDKNFLVQKHIFLCLLGTIRHSVVLQSK